MKSNSNQQGDLENSDRNCSEKKEANKYLDEYGQITNVDFSDESLMNLIKNELTKNKNIDMFFKALCLCHSVISFYDEENNKLDYFASSLDEKAIVNGCRYLKYVYMNKDYQNNINLKINEKDHIFKLLNTLDFDSERKRMSVIVKDENEKIYLFIKGGDDVLRKLTKKNSEYTNKNKNQNYYFSTKGLRTLNVAYKEIREEEFLRWENEFKVNFKYKFNVFTLKFLLIK